MPHHNHAFEAIGTQWTIDSSAELTKQDWSILLGKVAKRIERFDKNYSRFRPDSLVTTMSRRAGVYDLPPDGFPLLSFYKDLYDVTNGLVTPLIGQVLADAGYDANYSFRSKALSRPPTWDKALLLSKTRLEIKQPVLLDFGAAGKGYLVDVIANILEENDVCQFTINAGGDIIHRDTTGKTINVGLENPLDKSEVVGIASLGNRSLCASSGSRRNWDKYHHIFHPVSLVSPREVIATWVAANDTMTADGLATALFFVKPQKLQASYDFDYAVLYKDMSMRRSGSMLSEVFERLTNETD